MTEEVKPEKGAKEAEHPKGKEIEPVKAQPEGEAPADEASADGDDAPEKPKKQKPWFQTRIDEVTKARREAERRAEYWERIATQSQQPKQPAQEAKREDTPPHPSQFRSNEEYIRAEARYWARKELTDAERKRQEEAEQKAKREAAEKRLRSFAEREAKIEQEHPDYRDVAYSDDVTITEAMAEEIRQSEFGPEIAYFLGKNPAKSLEIAQLTEAGAIARAIGRIEAQIEASQKAPPPPKAAPTGAPPPPKTLSGSAPVQKDPEQMTTKEWMAWRNSQLRKKR